MRSGLKRTVKTAVIRGFREALTKDFWKTAFPSLEQVDPANFIFPEFPLEKVAYPFIRVNTNISQIEQLQVGKYENRGVEGTTWQTLKANLTIQVVFYCLEPEQRDDLTDAYMNAIMFSHLRPKESVLLQYLYQLENSHIVLDTSKISLTADSASKGIPWDQGQVVYSNSISVAGQITFDAILDDEVVETIKEIDIDAKS
jgi:hypothetical protein